MCVCVLIFSVGFFTVFAHLTQCETKDCQREQASGRQTDRERERQNGWLANKKRIVIGWEKADRDREGIREGQLITLKSRRQLKISL